MISRKIQPRRRGRRMVVGLAATAIVAGSLLAGGVALAVHNEDFQLDGDVSSSTTTNAGGTTQTIDWDQIINANGTAKADADLPAGFSDAGFRKDFNNDGLTFLTNDTTTFATGSKDTLPIAGWQCNYDNNVNSKVDIMNAYAVSYDASGDEYMYFALERNTNTGDANVGFWFLQGEVGCESAGGAVDFQGEHQDGDVLVVSEFSNGGTVSTINVYKWEDPDPTDTDPGSLNPTPIGAGVDCRDPLTLPGDAACAAANTIANGTDGTITTPWLTSNAKDKVGNSLRTSEFFEGGINLTDLGLGGQCFNTFIGNTRSSTSLTATLFDYAGGTLGGCTSTTVTTPKYNDGDSFENIPAGGISIGANARVEVRDSALLTVEGVTGYGGTVSFNLCGPLALDSTSNCNTGGVAIGSPVAVAGTSPETVLGPTATLTSAGRYCWRATYSGDATKDVPGSSDPMPTDTTTVTECFKVNPVQPTLATQATVGPVTFGSVISDKVYLSGTAKQPGTDGVGPGGTINATAGTQAAANGTINVTAYGPDNCTTVALAQVGLTVSGDRAAEPLFYGGPGSATEFTPLSPGQYTFVASYTGDNPNTLDVEATPCASQPSNEKVTVQQIPTTITTTPSAYPQDSATIASSVAGDSLPSNGTVIFRMYDNSTCTAEDDDVLGNGLLYKETKTGVGGLNSVTVSTSNTTVSVNTDQTVYWKVTYATGDSAHTGRQSNCVESILFDFTGDAGPGTLFP